VVGGIGSHIHIAGACLQARLRHQAAVILVCITSRYAQGHNSDALRITVHRAARALAMPRTESTTAAFHLSNQHQPSAFAKY
jgi:hypothetical protein